jgi:eukaryotic-like serine/threonine-protein kinase
VAIGGWDLVRSGRKSGSGNAGRGNLTSADQAHKPLPPSGTRLWSFPANSTVESVAASGGVAFAGTSADAVYAMDGRTGRQLWRFATSSTPNDQLVAAGGLVFVGCSFGGVTAVDAATGQQRWAIEASADFGLAVSGDVLYAGMSPKTPEHGGAVAVSAQTGETLWTYVLYTGGISNIVGGLAVGGGLVYLSTSEGEMLALHTASGTLAWSRFLDGQEFTGPGPVVAGGVVYAGSQGGAVYALDATSGQVLWHRAVGKGASVTVADGVVFASSASGLTALNASTGAVLWRASVPQGIFMSTAAGNAVYGGGDDGSLYAWQATTGNQLWTVTTGGPIASNVAVADGIVYAGSGDHHAYAVTA